MTFLTAMPGLVGVRRMAADDLALLDHAAGDELVDGRLREPNATIKSGRARMRIGTLLTIEAHRTGNAGVYGTHPGYQRFTTDSTQEVRRPDVSVIRRGRLTGLADDVGSMPVPADLAVEALSPNDPVRDVNDKVEQYLAAGFPIVWVVDPVVKTVMIHRRGGPVAKLYEHEEITGETALPGFGCCRVGEMIG